MANRRKRTLAPIGILIKKRMVDLNMTKRDLAASIGANYNYITNIFYGERSGEKYMDKIAEVLNLDLNELKNCA